MTRLTKDEIVEHKKWLAASREPGPLADYVNHIMDYMGTEGLFNQAGIEFLRDAWVAARFAGLRGATTVRLVDDTGDQTGRGRYRSTSQTSVTTGAIVAPSVSRGQRRRGRAGPRRVTSWLERAPKHRGGPSLL